jgi:hypothetical protein
MTNELVKADGVITITVDLEYAKLLMTGIRRLHKTWLASLSEEEASAPRDNDIHAASVLPNHIARALHDLRAKVEDVKVEW